jgi:hypothetical protein
MMPQTMQNESALVRAARAGDKEALRLLLTRNWNWLRALVFSTVSDGHDLDDILQDICVRVISRIGGLRENSFGPHGVERQGYTTSQCQNPCSRSGGKTGDIGAGKAPPGFKIPAPAVIMLAITEHSAN